MPRKKKSRALKTHPRNACYFNTLESEDHIEALLSAIYGDEPFKRLSEEELRFQCDCNHERFLNALASLPASDLEEMKDEDHGAEITCQFCQTHYHFDENDLEELIRDKS